MKTTSTRHLSSAQLIDAYMLEAFGCTTDQYPNTTMDSDDIWLERFAKFVAQSSDVREVSVMGITLYFVDREDVLV